MSLNKTWLSLIQALLSHWRHCNLLRNCQATARRSLCLWYSQVSDDTYMENQHEMVTHSLVRNTRSLSWPINYINIVGDVFSVLVSKKKEKLFTHENSQQVQSHCVPTRGYLIFPGGLESAPVTAKGSGWRSSPAGHPVPTGAPSPHAASPESLLPWLPATTHFRSRRVLHLLPPSHFSKEQIQALSVPLPNFPVAWGNAPASLTTFFPPFLLGKPDKDYISKSFTETELTSSLNSACQIFHFGTWGQGWHLAPHSAPTGPPRAGAPEFPPLSNRQGPRGQWERPLTSESGHTLQGAAYSAGREGSLLPGSSAATPSVVLLFASFWAFPPHRVEKQSKQLKQLVPFCCCCCCCCIPWEVLHDACYYFTFTLELSAGSRLTRPSDYYLTLTLKPSVSYQRAQHAYVNNGNHSYSPQTQPTHLHRNWNT